MYELTAASKLKSRKSFLRTVPPLDKHTTHQLKTQNLWQNYTDNIPDQHKLQNFQVQESLPRGYKLQWNKWRCLNRLRSGVGKTKSLLLKWGYLPPALIPPASVEKKIKPLLRKWGYLPPPPPPALIPPASVEKKIKPSTIS